MKLHKLPLALSCFNLFVATTGLSHPVWDKAISADSPPFAAVIRAEVVGVVNEPGPVRSQVPSERAAERADKAFKLANELMDQGKHGEALKHYEEALALFPDDPALLFNGGLAAYLSRDYSTAAGLWKRLRKVDPQEWSVRAKLVQVYQAQGKSAERDAERAELFALRKSNKIEELSQQSQYCRDQFEVKGLRVMVLEHFELKGDRALRYVFSVLNETGDGEQFRISLGSYEFTNSVWRETSKPKPKQGQRLFHLDGYFRGRHVTYGMFTPEPSYDDVRSRVITILEQQK